jgi:hypothetical protein
LQWIISVTFVRFGAMQPCRFSGRPVRDSVHSSRWLATTSFIITATGLSTLGLRVIYVGKIRSVLNSILCSTGSQGEGQGWCGHASLFCSRSWLLRFGVAQWSCCQMDHIGDRCWNPGVRWQRHGWDVQCSSGRGTSLSDRSSSDWLAFAVLQIIFNVFLHTLIPLGDIWRV